MGDAPAGGDGVGGLERLIEAVAGRRWPPWASYPIAAGAVLLAAAARILLPFAQYPFVLFFPVVFAISLGLGSGPGLFAILFSFVLGASFLPEAVRAQGGGWPIVFAGVAYGLLNGAVAAVCGAFRANARRRGEELEHARALEGALRESERRFRLIADAAPAPMWVTRLDRRRSFVNRAYLQFLGQPYEEALDYDWRHALHGEDLARVAAEQVAGEASLKPFTLEARYRDAQGRWRWLRSDSQPRWDAEGRHIGFIGMAYDVTVAREAQAALERMNATLEERVAERTAELEATQTALRQSQKLEAVGQLTGGIAHDFNNLLTIIRSSVDFLRRPDVPEARRARYVEAISETVERASRLTGQLLAFARRQSLKPEVFDVAERVRAVAELLRPLLGAGITLDVSACPPELLAKADVAQFETALVNLAVNARDALDGAGVICVSATAADLLPSLRGEPPRTGTFVALEVGDDGPGVPEALSERILEPFFTTKPVGKGTGLGLSQVFGFAKQSGGELKVGRSKAGGAAFTLYLPVGVTEPAAPAERTLRPGLVQPPSRRGYRVLVVEDDRLVGQFSTEILNDLGYETVWAVDAQDALRRLDEARDGVDLMFSDVIMPGMSGVELAAAVRSNRPDLPIVLTSGYSQALAQDGLGGFDLLRKPYSAAGLAEVLDRALGDRPPVAARRDQAARTTLSTASP